MHSFARRVTALTRLDGSKQEATKDNGSHSTDNGTAPATVSTTYIPSQDRSWIQNIQRRLDTLRRQKQPIQQLEHPVPCNSDSLVKSITETNDCTPAGTNESVSDARVIHNDSTKSNHSIAQVGPRGSLASTSSNSRGSNPSLFSLNSVTTSLSDVSMSPVALCDMNGLRVRLVKRLKDSFLYVAQDEVTLPPETVEQWEATDLERLKTDLREVVMQIYRKGIDREAQQRRSPSYFHSGTHEYDITFELRWSGRSTRQSQKLTLEPAIWIICGSRWACRDIRAAMEGITWITLPIEIHQGSVPQLSTREELVDINALDLTHGIHVAEGITLYVNVEESASSSACGLLCCATIKDGNAYSHHFSRIGGLLSATETLNSSQFGISTAHGMLGHPWWHDKVADMYAAVTSRPWSCENDLDSSTEVMNDISDDEESEEDDGEYKGQDLNNSENLFVKSDLSKDRAGFRDPSLVAAWRNVSYEGVFSFLGASMTVGDGQHQGRARLHTDLRSQTDHAMLRLGHLKSTITPELANTYCRMGALTKDMIRVTRYEVNDQLNEGPVDIICGPYAILSGLLLPASSCLVVGGEMFTLRKLRTDKILAQGTSGLWVVKGATLCGMIIAVSVTESYAFMITAKNLLSNIKSSSPSIEVIGLCSESEPRKFYATDIPPSPEWPLNSTWTTPRPTIMASSLHSQEHDHTLSEIRTGTSRPSISASADVSEQVAVRRKSRWPLPDVPERISEFLGAKLFNKVEVDEIVTSDHVEQYRSQRLSQIPLNGYNLSSHGLRRFKKPRRRREHPACLPTIPESTHKTDEENTSLDSDLSSMYFFLGSPPYTLTVPAFRHGPIRLAKPDPMSDHVHKTSDAPDWTSFQIAAFGAFCPDLISQDDADEADELIIWWESWNLGGPGQLIGEWAVEIPSLSSTPSSDYPDLVFSEIESDDTYSASSELSGWQSPQSRKSVEEPIPLELGAYESHDIEQAAF